MEKTKVLCSLIVFGLFFWILPSTGGAATINVNCDTGGVLQTAIDGGDSGDTLLVTGICTENVIIRKSLTVDGNTTAEIHGPDTTKSTVAITTSSITVKNFKSIQGGSYGISVTTVSAATISNNTIKNTGSSGILLVGNQRSTIDSNTIQNTNGNGVSVGQNSFAFIINNTITNNSAHGIEVWESSGARIGFSSSSDTTASPNTITSNGENGIYLWASSNARIVGNTISNNTGNGVRVYQLSHAQISDNTINNNGTGSLNSGISVIESSGVDLGSTTGTTIFDLPNNTTVNNSYVGINFGAGAYVSGRIGTLYGVYGAIGNTGIGIKTSTLAGDLGIDVMAASNGVIRLGNAAANNTNKAARMVVRHYDNSQLPVYLFGSASTSTDNFVAFGGGADIGNAATQLDLFTALNTTTPIGTPRLTIINNGNVGIGTQTPAYPLHMASGARVTAGGVWTDASSREFKDNVKGLKVEDAIETLQGLNPVTFNYKVSPEENHVGFVAEDVPDLVATKDRKGLSPMDIVAVLTKVVQELKARNEMLEERLLALEGKGKTEK